MICGANNAVEYYGKRIKILHGCPFEGWPNRARPFKPFLPKRVGWPCPVRSALKRTPVQDFNSFSILFYYIISTTYQKIGDLFCLVIFLDFRTVWVQGSSTKDSNNFSWSLLMHIFHRNMLFGSSFVINFWADREFVNFILKIYWGNLQLWSCWKQDTIQQNTIVQNYLKIIRHCFLS